MASDAQIRLRLEGAGDTTVVLIHGVPGSAAIWEDLLPLLSSDHRVVIADLLGFGASDRPLAAADLWVDAQATALAAALDRGGIGRAVVVGHDFGVPVGLRVAANDPGRVAAFGLLAGNVFPDTPIPLPISAVTWPLVGGIAGRQAEVVQAPRSCADGEDARKLRSGAGRVVVGGGDQGDRGADADDGIEDTVDRFRQPRLDPQLWERYDRAQFLHLRPA